MIKSRTSINLLLSALALLAWPAVAQSPAAPTADAPAANAEVPAAVPAPVPGDGRDASFLPPGKSTAPATATDQPAAPQPSPAVANPPAISTPPSANPSPSAAPAPATYPATTPTPESADKSAVIGKPVESGGVLQNIDPDAVGLLAPEEGGLGAAMWKGTPRELAGHLLPILSVPTTSPTFNNLAQRFLLTTANVPEGTAPAGSRSLTSMRIEKLVALGDAADAWKLAALAKPEQVDEITLRQTVEAALVSDESKTICAKLPQLIQTHTSPEWQKSLVVCQLMANDSKAAQLGLEVLHTQDVKDDVFFQLVEHNIIGGAKALPRQLTPLKPLNMALLNLIAQPLPPEVYSRPEGSVIPALLQAKARDESARLALAERAATRGIISSATLADIYRSISFPPDQLVNAISSQETGGRLHALLYQAAMQEKTPQKRLDDADKFMQSLDGLAFGGSLARLLADMIKDIPATADYVVRAPTAAHIFILADRPKEASDWFKVAQQAAESSPNAASQVQVFWPLAPLAGIESDSDYNTMLGKWLDVALKDADHAQRERIGGVLLLLDAARFAVPENDWARVVDEPSGAHRAILPPTLIFERLRSSAAANRRGETVLYALAMSDPTVVEPPLLTSIETVRALRLVDLRADAMALAREAAASLLAPETGSADGKK